MLVLNCLYFLLIVCIYKSTRTKRYVGRIIIRIISYHTDIETHPLVKCALFSYDFVSIHPFQDGNGRLSRLLATLLLLKNGYNMVLVQERIIVYRHG
jgi:Fic family protein